MEKPVLLAVDDNPVNQKVVSVLAERYGYEVVVVRSGHEALEALKKRETPFDAILMDLNMPVMDGLECTRQIREFEKEKNHNTPIIGLSAHSSESQSRECLAGGMDDYLSKPFDTVHFQNTLAHWTTVSARHKLRVVTSKEDRESASA
ncbi:MAG: response regulator [Candidatus Obscuribacterales bacterium]|nr:response regulator [Candidatus Obscuribacterales bacterium]